MLPSLCVSVCCYECMMCVNRGVVLLHLCGAGTQSSGETPHKHSCCSQMLCASVWIISHAHGNHISINMPSIKLKVFVCVCVFGCMMYKCILFRIQNMCHLPCIGLCVSLNGVYACQSCMCCIF